MRPSAELITAVAIGCALVYAAVALTVRARSLAARGPSLRRVGGLASTLPLLIWVPYVVIAARTGPEIDVPEPLRWAGVALIVGGMAFSIWGAATLGRHFDLEVEIHRGHEVVDRGPYAVVRHPVYAGLAVHFLGACLATGNWLLIAGTLFVTLPALRYRAMAEETLLRELPGYAEYARRVGQLVPKLR